MTISVPAIIEYPVHRYQLRPFVQTIWALETELPSAMPGIVAPDAQVEFVFFMRGRGYLRIHDVESRMRVQPKAFAYTQMKGCLDIATSGLASFIAFRTNQATAQMLVGFPTIQQRDDFIDLESLWLSDVEQLLRALMASAIVNRGKILEKFTGRRLMEFNNDKQDVARIYDWILANGGLMRVREVASFICLTQRTLERRLQSTGGMTPKSIASMGRFLMSCKLLRSESTLDISDVAYQLGFADHAHFSQDFGRYALMTPSRFRASTRADMVDPSSIAARSN